MELFLAGSWAVMQTDDREPIPHNALSRMQESKPRRTGPMIMQPIDHGATMPVPLLPVMPGPDGTDNAKAAAESEIDKNGSGPPREGENHRGAIHCENSGWPRRVIPPASVSGVARPVEVAKVRQAMHSQTVFVLFALDV